MKLRHIRRCEKKANKIAKMNCMARDANVWNEMESSSMTDIATGSLVYSS
jgi:hypothetical protein